VAPGLGRDLGDRLLGGPSRLYGRTWVSESNTSATATIRAAQGDLLAAQAVRIPAAVPPLVVGHGDLLGELEHGYRLPDRMRAPMPVWVSISGPLLGGEAPLLQQDGVGDADLANVVQGRGLAHEIHAVVREPQDLREASGQPADALRVLPRVVVAELGGAGQTV
jgi:hypothetical protein